MQSPLAELTQAAGAVLSPGSEWQQPLHYGNPHAEYDAALTNAVLRDCSHLGRILFSGADHLDFLQRMSTNDFASLPTANGLQAVLTDNRGRILELGTFCRHDEQTLAMVSAGGSQAIMEWLDRYLFSEKVEMTDLSPVTGMVEILGPKASALVTSVVGTVVPTANHQLLRAPGDDDLWMARADRFGHEGVAICGPPASLRTLWLALRKAGAAPIGEAAFEILRIEAGLPAAGAELTEDHNPWEAGLAETIHMDKGCYVGQEVLARLNTYDKVKQHLVGLRLPTGASTEPSTPLKAPDGGRDAGLITSTCHSPRYGEIALAYVRSAHAAAGADLICAGTEAEVPATVTELPFR